MVKRYIRIYKRKDNLEELYTEEYQPVEVVEEGIEISEGIEETYFADDTPESDNIFASGSVWHGWAIERRTAESRTSEPEPN